MHKHIKVHFRNLISRRSSLLRNRSDPPLGSLLWVDEAEGGAHVGDLHRAVAVGGQRVGVGLGVLGHDGGGSAALRARRELRGGCGLNNEDLCGR